MVSAIEGRSLSSFPNALPASIASPSTPRSRYLQHKTLRTKHQEPSIPSTARAGTQATCTSSNLPISIIQKKNNNSTLHYRQPHQITTHQTNLEFITQYNKNTTFTPAARQKPSLSQFTRNLLHTSTRFTLLLSLSSLLLRSTFRFSRLDPHTRTTRAKAYISNCSCIQRLL